MRNELVRSDRATLALHNITYFGLSSRCKWLPGLSSRTWYCVLLYAGLPAPTLCDCFIVIALHRQVPGGLNGAMPCNAHEGYCHITCSMVWCSSKGPRWVSGKGASQLEHGTWFCCWFGNQPTPKTPVSCQFLYCKSVVAWGSTFCEQLYHVVQSPNAIYSCSQSQ